MNEFMRKYSLPGILYRTYFTLAAALACAFVPLQLTAAEYYVSQTGDDAKGGSQAAPFKTISAAAEKAQPGDTITVHAGVYRERINPPRGGTADANRIT